MTIVNYVCKRCESSDVTFTFDARWNVLKQTMDYDYIPYDIFCHECVDNTAVKAIETIEE